MKQVTPSQFLRIGSQDSLSTPNLMRSDSCFFQQQLLMGAPKGFNYDVIFPNKSHISPLNDASGSSDAFTLDADKDMDSTDYSQESKETTSTEKTKFKKFIEINGMIIDDFLASDDLNECVDFLLRKEKPDNRIKS